MKPTAKHRWAALCALPLLLAGPAQAGDILNVKITQVSPDKDGKVVLYVDRARTNKAACAQSDVTYSVNATTAGGQAMLSAIYTAIAADLPVDIVGSSLCAEYSNTESIGYVSLHRRGG
ncbi:MAG TPA: hypothetical protein VN158_16670 [Caulobacter sp.]|nr:hypothetical protein [Caulobacter sp.]